MSDILNMSYDLQPMRKALVISCNKNSAPGQKLDPSSLGFKRMFRTPAELENYTPSAYLNPLYYHKN